MQQHYTRLLILSFNLKPGHLCDVCTDREVDHLFSMTLTDLLCKAPEEMSNEMTDFFFTSTSNVIRLPLQCAGIGAAGVVC